MHLRTLALFLPLCAAAHSQSMPGMTMPDQPMSMPQPTTLIESILQHASSGTSAEPPSTPTAMLMHQLPGGWLLMLHGNAFLTETQQQASSGRGADKIFSTNWIMPMAQHRLGARGEITLRTMLDLEPATITHGFYPELFQQGETAHNQPIVDGQHPHDALMELAALYDYRASSHTLLSLYLAPVGDPALGPTAYPHRLSASEDPIAALGHHQQDSTHIAFNVLTAALTHGPVRVEASGFHGAEPTEARWHFQPSPNGTTPDSYSTRLTYTPTANVSTQYSIAHLTSPEQLLPAENQRRQTASVMYNRPFGAHHDTTSMPGMDMSTPATGNWSTTLLWGHAASRGGGPTQNSLLLESLLQFHRRNFVWTRIESAARTTELLHAPAEASAGHAGAYTLGYDRDFSLFPHLLAAPGAQFTLYRTPGPLAPAYGRYPTAVQWFVRLRLK